jgi:hypothetical protein
MATKNSKLDCLLLIHAQEGDLPKVKESLKNISDKEVKDEKG